MERYISEKLEVKGLGMEGDGLASSSKGTLFIEGALPGDKVQVKILRDKKGILRGEIEKLLAPSPYRVTPPCPHFERCGGCTLQHLQPETYRKWKLEMVRENFQKVGIRPIKWLPPVFLEEKNRRRATFSAIKTRSHVHFGYYQRRSSQIISIDECRVLEPRLFQAALELKSLLPKILLESSPTDFFLQISGNSLEIIITGPLAQRPETAPLLARIPELKRVGWRKDSKSPVQTLFSKGPLLGQFGRLQVELPPLAFLQPTASGEQALVQAVMESISKEGPGADLFSGIGTFAGALLEKMAVDAYESEVAACKALQAATKRERLGVFRRDLFRNPLLPRELNRYRTIIFDPPRAGAEAQATEMADSKVGTIVGVSCNPATLARDVRILCDGGYWLQSLKVVDQFVWSHHVEVIAVLTKKKSSSKK